MPAVPAFRPSLKEVLAETLKVTAAVESTRAKASHARKHACQQPAVLGSRHCLMTGLEFADGDKFECSNLHFAAVILQIPNYETIWLFLSLHKGSPAYINEFFVTV